MHATEQQLLHAVFCLSRSASPITLATLASAAGLTPTQAAVALITLDTAGLVDASRLRLTWRGLAMATRLESTARALRLDVIRERARQRRRPTVLAHVTRSLRAS